MSQTNILKDWSPDKTRLFGRQPLQLSHTLSQSTLFGEDSLADLIEQVPASHYNLNTMGYDHENPEWKEGSIAGHSGQEVLSAIKNGRMWLNLRRLPEVDDRFRDLINRMMAELSANVPGLSTYRHDLGLLISSPKVRVFYHADVPGQALWQISGRKKISVYPNEQPFLEPKDFEKVVLGMTEEEIPYEPWFDGFARSYELEPGDMIHWPLNAPHQVINGDCLNISITTSYWTKEIRNSYAVNYANGVLRQNFGLNPTSNRPGISLYPKAALAFAWKSLQLQKAKKLERKIEFHIDPDAADGMRQIPAQSII